MKFVPIIDIQNGITSFGLPEKDGMSARIKNPVLHFRYWVDKGADRVFFKDKDGAIIGKPQHTNFLEYLDGTNNAHLYYCGGIRDLRSVRIFEHRKYTKIVSATSLVENKKFLRNILMNNIGPIALWIDSLDGFVHTRGARYSVGKRTVDFLRSLPESGIDEIFYCGWSQQGPLEHPDFDTLESFLDMEIPALYIAGNVTTKDDIEQLLQYQELTGIALSKPLYDGTLSISEVSEMFRVQNIRL